MEVGAVHAPTDESDLDQDATFEGIWCLKMGVSVPGEDSGPKSQKAELNPFCLPPLLRGLAGIVLRRPKDRSRPTRIQKTVNDSTSSVSTHQILISPSIMIPLGHLPSGHLREHGKLGGMSTLSANYRCPALRVAPG